MTHFAGAAASANITSKISILHQLFSCGGPTPATPWNGFNYRSQRMIINKRPEF
jgi:hypothetical protein